jgi:RimJ/RimL family protein N-acetyltransferase
MLTPIHLGKTYSEEKYNNPNCKVLFESMKPFYEKFGYVLPWVVYMIKDETKVYGTTSFVGPPVEGKDELAHWTFSSFEGKGIALFGCASMVKLVKQTDPDIIVTAKTAPEHNPSTRILDKNGFQFMGVVQDHEIGDAWSWQLK